MAFSLEDLDRDYSLPSTKSGSKPEDDRFEITKGFAAGIDQTQALGGGLLALIGSATGSDSLMFAGLDYYNEQMAEAAESQADVGRFEDIDGFDDFLSYALYTAGNAIPSLASAAVSGGVGGVVAKGLVKKGIQEKAKEYASKRVKDQASDHFKKRVADDYASAALSKTARLGAGVGAGAFSVGMGAGESFTRILEQTGEEATGVALATGLVSGGLDALAPMRALKRIFPKKEFESARQAIGDAAARKTSLTSRVFREAGKQAGVEGVTEAMQELVQTIAAEYVDNNYSVLGEDYRAALFDESKRSAYINAFAAGVFGGGAFGGVSGLVTRDPDSTSRVSEEELAEVDERVEQESQRVDRANLRSEEAFGEMSEESLPVDEVQQARDRQEEVRNRIRKQIDARATVQEVIEAVEAEPVDAPLVDEPSADAQEVEAPVSPPAPRSVINDPATATPLASLIGQEVGYGDTRGILTRKDDGFFYVVTGDEDVFIEAGEGATAESLGVLPSQVPLQFENEVTFSAEDSSFTLRGEKYTYLRANTDESGATISIQAIDENGERRTIRNRESVERIERLKAQSEEPATNINIPFDRLSGQMQESFVDEAEAEGVEIPDEVPVQTALDKAMKLEGMAREMALARIDEAIFSSITLKKDLSEIQKPSRFPFSEEGRNAEYETKLSVQQNQSFNRASDRGASVPFRQTLDQALEENSQMSGSTVLYKGTNDAYTPNDITLEDLYGGFLSFSTRERETTNIQTLGDIKTAGLNPKGETFALAITDLVSSGLPKNWLRSVDSFGFFTAQQIKDGEPPQGFFGRIKNPITNETAVAHVAVQAKYLSQNRKYANQLRFTLAHEIAHAADAKFNFSSTLPGFKAELVKSDEGEVNFQAAEIVAELYQAYVNQTDLGVELDYPFTLVEGMISNGQSHSGVIEFLQKELFAQASATFLTHPQKLKTDTPKTYKLMLDLFDGSRRISQPTANQGNVDGTNNTESNLGLTTGPVSEEIRTPAQPRGVQDARENGDGAQSQGSPQEGQAGSVMGGEAVQGDGDSRGPSIPEEGVPSRELTSIEDMVVSTRFPTGATSKEDPVNNTLVNTYGSFKESPVFAKNMKLVKKYNNLTKQEAARKDESVAEALIEHAKANLLYIFDQIPQSIRDRSKLWYVGANKIANDLARTYSTGNETVSLAQTAAVLANLSPQKDWYMNADLGRRVMDIYFNKWSESFDQSMKDTAERLYFEGSAKTQVQNREILNDIGNRSLEEIWNDASLSEPRKNLYTAFWIRTYDQAYNGRSYPIVSPEGEFLDSAKNADGSDSSVGWGSFNEIAKAVSVLRDGSQENITMSLGSANKVRNFYNNIYEPTSILGFVTIDTHAVAAALLKPLAGNSREVAHNFGGQYQKGEPGASSSKITGHSGTYTLYEEAYRRAAEERGVLPREMQSITWEAVRGLFTPTYKANENNVNYIESIWDNYRNGKTSLEEARRLIYDHAEGIQAPAWDGSDTRLDGRGEPAIEQRDLPEPRVSRPEPRPEGEPPARGGVDAAGVPATQSVVSDLPSPEVDTTGDTAELNAQIREENQPKFNRVKKELKRLLAPGGLLPKQVFDAKIERDSEMGAVEIDIRQILRKFDDAVQFAFGRKLDDEENQQIHDALTKDFAKIDTLGLDADVKDAVVMMRKYLDNMSVDYAQILFQEAQELAAKGKDEAATAKIDLIQTIVGNAGQYLHRSYRAFDDPNWAKNVPDDVLDAARKYLQDKGTTNVENVLNQILKEGTAFDSMEGFIRESKLGAKDLSILKQRKDIAPEIRALLGEYIDPKINFTKSATKMSRLLFNDRFLKRVKSEGMGVFLFDDETAPPEAYQKFASDQSDVMAPLNGLRATPELVQAFQDALGKEQMADWYRAIVQTNGLIKYGKTVIAPTTIARNFLSAYMFTLANGHFNLGKSAESIANLESYFKTKGDKVKYMRRLRELGVVYDTPYAGEMMALLDESNYDVMFGGKFKGLKGFFDNATRFYQFGDDFWKIVGFENELDLLMDRKGLTREQAEPLAAERIRNTYPTYSMVGLGVQKLRRFPLVGTFVSFPAEMIRTSFNILKYMQKDMKDPDMAGLVPRRVAGLAMVSAGVYALQEALMNMVDVDEDEEEAVRLLGPEWSQNSNLAFIGREEGKLQYVDLSAFDPYNYFKRPLNALLRDQPIDDAVYQSAKELLTPFFGQDIAFQNIVEIWQNEKGSGGSVYNEQDSSSEQLESIIGHVIKGIGPSVVQNINRTYKALEGERNAAGRVYKLEDEMAALTGLRVTTLDPKVSLHFKAYDFNQAKSDATRILTSTFRDINDVSDSELKDSFVRASNARREAFERMIKIVEAARKAGLSRSEIISVLRSNGVSKKDAIALEEGVAGSWSLSDTTLKNSVKKADLLFGEATGREYERRWSLIEGLMEQE